MIDVMDNATAYMEIIRDNIEYEHHMKYGDWQDKGLYEELYEVICEIVCVKRKAVKWLCSLHSSSLSCRMR